jgi:signal transduction histidine kinase
MTGPTPQAPAPGPVTGGQDAWDRSRVFWHAYYGAALAVTVGVVLTASGVSARERIIASAALGAMAVWYATLGRPVTQIENIGAAREVTYLLVLFGLFVVAVEQTGSSAFILLAACPQCFFAASSWPRAVTFVAAFNLAPPVVAAVTMSGHARAQILPELFGIAALGIAFSVVFGGWIGGIVNQSMERARLIERLESAQADLATANREAGMLAERQRLATDIHDTIAQGFTSIVMLIQAAEPEIGRDDQAARRYLDVALRTARENLAEARALVAALTPTHLESGSLGDALRRVTERTEAEHGLAATFEVTGTTRPLPAATEVMLLRVCQEALANVGKHAHADQARVRLGYAAGAVRLEVSDDGAGFDPAQVNGGYGLRGMRGRVGEGGGTLVVRSAPGTGTSLCVEVPA